MPNRPTHGLAAGSAHQSPKTDDAMEAMRPLSPARCHRHPSAHPTVSPKTSYRIVPDERRIVLILPALDLLVLDIIKQFIHVEPSDFVDQAMFALGIDVALQMALDLAFRSEALLVHIFADPIRGDLLEGARLGSARAFCGSARN
jgi:hypothetical protein